MTEWLKVCALDDIPLLGARVVKTERGDIAVFRTSNGEVFAMHDRCPHKGGPLSQGIVFDKRVACPLHGMTISLESGEAVAPDKGCVRKHAVKVEDEVVFLEV